MKKVMLLLMVSAGVLGVGCSTASEKRPADESWPDPSELKLPDDLSGIGGLEETETETGQSPVRRELKAEKRSCTPDITWQYPLRSPLTAEERSALQTLALEVMCAVVKYDVSLIYNNIHNDLGLWVDELQRKSKSLLKMQNSQSYVTTEYGVTRRRQFEGRFYRRLFNEEQSVRQAIISSRTMTARADKGKRVVVYKFEGNGSLTLGLQQWKGHWRLSHLY